MFSITRCIQSKVFRIMVLLAFICLLARPHALSTFNVLSGIDNSDVSEINNLRRVATITMLYGEPDEIYDRAMRSHERYCKRRGYPMHRLSQDIFKSFWNKPYYILSILMQELAKRPSERVQWFMWFDADTILLNPQIPVEIFLPPADFNHIHFIGTKDENGLNSGVFFIHVHEWSVRMIAKSIGFPLFRQDIDLGYSIDQAAMAHILHDPENHDHVLYQPRHWFNTYYGGRKGDLLVHFPGIPKNERRHLMHTWLDEFEIRPRQFDIALENTTYIEDIANYWDVLRGARSILRAVDLHETGVSVISEDMTLAIWRLRTLLWEGVEEPGELNKLVKDLTPMIRVQEM